MDKEKINKILEKLKFELDLIIGQYNDNCSGAMTVFEELKNEINKDKPNKIEICCGTCNNFGNKLKLDPCIECINHYNNTGDWYTFYMPIN